MKKIGMVLCSVGLFLSSIDIVQAQEEKNLDLHTEDATRENKTSLTDENGIPIFTDEYQEKETTVFILEDIFVKDMQVVQKETIKKENLFQGSTKIGSKLKDTNISNQATVWILSIGIMITIIVTVIATIVYQKHKYQQGGNYDSNIYEKQNTYGS